MYCIIAGCGRVGSQLAEALSYDGHDVVIIDRNPSSFKRLGRDFNGITLEGVAFDEEVLLDAGAEQADALAAVTNADNTNLMTSEMALKIYDIPTVISRLYNPGMELTFFKMGVDYICSTTLMTERIGEKLFQGEDVIVQQDRLDAGLQVVEFAVGDGAGGRAAGDLNYGVSSRLILLLRDNKEVQWSESTPLRPGDRVIITVRKEGWSTVRDCLGDVSPATYGCPAGIMPPALAAGETFDSVSGAKVIVAGCSQVGSHLAYTLSMNGFEVTVIDSNPDLFRRLPPAFRGNLVQGTVYDEETLLEAGIEEADAFTALTKFDNTNLMAAEVARHVFEVPHVMARLFNPDKEATYQALGLGYVCGTRLLSQALLEHLLKPLVRVRNACFNNLYDLVEFDCPRSWDGRSVGQVRKKTGATLAHLVRRDSGYMPEDNFVLHDGDAVTALVEAGKLTKLERLLKKR